MDISLTHSLIQSVNHAICHHTVHPPIVSIGVCLVDHITVLGQRFACTKVGRKNMIHDEEQCGGMWGRKVNGKRGVHSG